MKRCLLFFLALVLAIALATSTESAVDKGVQEQTALNYIQEDRITEEVDPGWASTEPAEDYENQSQKP